MKSPLVWKIKDDNGIITYKKGDVVLKNGKLYSATRTTNVNSGSPEHGLKAGWEELTEERIHKYSDSSTAPLDPFVGDEWLDLTTGNLYKYVEDGTSTQWVEI